MSSEAFVTLATNDGYALGALVVAESLRKVGTQRNLVVMVSRTLSDLIRLVWRCFSSVNFSLCSRFQTNITEQFWWSCCCWWIKFQWWTTFTIISSSWTRCHIYEDQLLATREIFEMRLSRCWYCCFAKYRWFIRSRRTVSSSGCWLAWLFQFGCFCLQTIQRNIQKIGGICESTRGIIRW